MMIEQMKPSGVGYLGDIPATWTAKRFKYCAQICNGGEYADIEIDEGGYPVIGSGGEFARASKFCYQGESVLLGRKGTIDKPLYVNDAFWCVDTMFYPKAKLNMVPKFLYYCALCFRFDYYVTSTALPSMTQKDLGSEMIAVPPTEEQKQIAMFLDTQCSKLDSVIADLEKQIDTLQKYKKSLLTETVTKGLDKSAPMKDSGIEWIGKIPEHWEVKKFSYECERIGDIDHYMPDSVDEGIPYVMTGDFIGDGNDIDFENCKQISRQDYLRLSRKMKPMINDILFARYATIGTVRIVDTDKEFLVSYSCAIIRVKKTLFSKYVFYYLKSGAFYEEISKYINTNTQGNVGIDSIGRAKIPLPPVSEQELIADFLDEKCTQIDELLQIKHSQLNSIKRHKKSLIYEYVTGKKRVTEVK